jgi:hypothetical protein
MYVVGQAVSTTVGLWTQGLMYIKFLTYTVTLPPQHPYPTRIPLKFMFMLVCVCFEFDSESKMIITNQSPSIRFYFSSGVKRLNSLVAIFSKVLIANSNLYLQQLDFGVLYSLRKVVQNTCTLCISFDFLFFLRKIIFCVVQLCLLFLITILCW